MKQTPLERAIKIAGSQGRLANAIGTKQQNVWKWLRRGKIPAEYVLPIELVTEGKVTKHELRPDIYPEDTSSG